MPNKSLIFLRIASGLQGRVRIVDIPGYLGSGMQKTLTTATPLDVRLVFPRKSQAGDAPTSFVNVRLKKVVSWAKGCSSVLHPRHKVQFGKLCFGT